MGKDKNDSNYNYISTTISTFLYYIQQYSRQISPFEVFTTRKPDYEKFKVLLLGVCKTPSETEMDIDL